MSEKDHSNAFRNGVLFAILILIAIGGYFYLSQKKILRKPEAKLVGTRCESPLTSTQLQKAIQIMEKVKKDITANNICRSQYLKGCTPPRDISPVCRVIYEDILAYLEEHTISFCKSDNGTIFAEVDPAIPDVIFLSDGFFGNGDDPERRRTLAHELTHLAGYIKPHNAEKNCVYFEDYSLQAEHCLTCEATFIASNEFSSCTTTPNGSFTISPK